MGRPTGKNAKLSDVAERAGVSKATASNVFNRPRAGAPEVRARVLAEADALGYTGPDPMGRLLSAGKVNAIGVATAEPLGYFFEDPSPGPDEGHHRDLRHQRHRHLADLGRQQDALAWSIKSAVVDGLMLSASRTPTPWSRPPASAGCRS